MCVYSCTGVYPCARVLVPVCVLFHMCVLVHVCVHSSMCVFVIKVERSHERERDIKGGARAGKRAQWNTSGMTAEGSKTVGQSRESQRRQ